METQTVTVEHGGQLVAVERYIVLGIDPFRRTTILAAAAHSEVHAEILAEERMQNKEMPYTHWSVFTWKPEVVDGQIRDWLKSWGFSPKHIRKIIRDLHANVQQLIADQVQRVERRAIPEAKIKPIQFNPQAKSNNV